MEATGQPISQYVAKKLNFSYEQASSSINEALKAETKKKNTFRDTKSEKRNQALKSLLYFSPTFDVCQSILPCLYMKYFVLIKKFTNFLDSFV